jgi:hypothetical protein
MTRENDTPTWAPRVKQHKIRRLYEDDALGIYDENLINDVGFGLLARCQSFIAANEAREGRAHCPRCGRTVEHTGHKEDLMRCPCGWQLTWGEYFETIQHKQLSGAEPVLRQFQDFVERFPSARTAAEKVLSIDQLLHGFHWYYKTNEPARPVAVNLIQGRLQQVIEFLDSLIYSEKSTPGAKENKAEWDQHISTARGWKRNE